MATRETVSVDLDTEVAAILRKHAAEANVSEGEILDRALRAYDLRALIARLQTQSDLDDDQANGRIELLMSPAILEEIADVLSRPRIRERLSANDALQFPADIASQVVMLADPADPPSVCRDRDDDYLVALTVTTGAEVLVTGDDDLRAVEPGRAGVEVLTPRQLIDRLG
jgi:uncharacterized protein